MTTNTCYSCKRIATIYNQQGLYCNICDRMFYNYGYKTSSEIKTTTKINNKKTHFKKILSSLKLIYIPESYLSNFDKIITSRNIRIEDVDINLVKWYLNTLNIRNTIMCFIMLNLIKNRKQSLDRFELEEACELFNEFIMFAHNIYPNFTVRYDFFIDKVLRFNNISFTFKSRNYKDVSRKNIYQMIWDKFLEYINEKLKVTFRTFIPQQLYEVEEEIIISD